MTESNVEGHPFFHEWYLHGDFVDQRKGQRIITVRREERCQHCPTERITVINCTQWMIVRRWYKYVKGVTIVRVGKSEWLKKEFLQTTNLRRGDVGRLRRPALHDVSWKSEVS